MVSVKVYYGSSPVNYEIRRFVFKPEQLRLGCGIYQALLDRICALYDGLNLHNLHLCWRDDDSDYVVFSSDDELKVAINSVTDNTLRIYIREFPSSEKEASFQRSSQYRRSEKWNEKMCKKQNGTVTNHIPELKDRNQTAANTNFNHCDIQPTTSNNENSTFQIFSSSSPLINNVKPGRTQISRFLPLVSPPPPPPSHRSPNLNEVIRGGPRLCSECKGEGRGVWYKCTMCCDFFLCSKCENRGLHDQHIMMRQTQQHQRQAFLAEASLEHSDGTNSENIASSSRRTHHYQSAR